jgi:rSAM/selenodomain-associated transferase 1
MTSVGIAIIAKTPEPGKSKTRLSPPLTPEQCAGISAAFICDLATNIAALDDGDTITGYSLYTPAGSEDAMRRLLPASFGLILQAPGDLGARLKAGIADILAEGHDAAIIVSSDSPTLPAAYFRQATDWLAAEDCVVLCPAVDGGYTFIGLRQPYARLFEEMPWSTESVYELTLQRAAEIGLKVRTTPIWYDVDDAATLAILEADLTGAPLPFPAAEPRMSAHATADFLGRLANAGPPASPLAMPSGGYEAVAP